MKKPIITIILATFMLIWIISFSSAACVIQGYTKDINNKGISSSILAYCQNDNSWRNITRNAGDLYGVSWGGPADSCQSKCGQVYIWAEHKSIIPEEPYLIGYPKNYPMTSGNTPQWNTGNPHNINITLLVVPNTLPKPSPIYKPNSPIQQKAITGQAIYSFNSVITREYKKDNLNVNKVQILMKGGKVGISSVKEPFWIIWWDAIKHFFGIK